MEKKWVVVAEGCLRPLRRSTASPFTARWQIAGWDWASARERLGWKLIDWN